MGNGDFSGAGQAQVDTFIYSYNAAGGQVIDTVLTSLHAVINYVESSTGLIEERSLSQDEVIYLRRIYGSSIDYSSATVQSGGIKEATGRTAHVVGNDIFMPEDSFQNGSPGLTQNRLELLSHEMGHVWQFQNQGPEYIHTALADQLNQGTDTQLGSGSTYDWLSVANRGVLFNDMGPESRLN